jgi:hypothetical protein
VILYCAKGIIMSNATLTLYFTPSPLGLDWSTPSKLARDIVKNYAVKSRFGHTKRFMGHVNVELKYKDDNENVDILTGMTAANLNALPLLLKDKIGLGIIFHSFPGRLESNEEIIPELAQYAEHGNKKMNFCRYRINLEMAKRVKQYIDIYKEHNMGRYYGLYNSALHGEGAGCSGFGASFLDVMGIINDEHRTHWANCVHVPHSIAGKPITKNKVNFLSLLFKDFEWSDKEDHHEIFFWDPDLMYQDTQRRLQKGSIPTNASIVMFDKTQGLEYDITDINPPTDPIFKRFNAEGDISSFPPELEKVSNINKYKV